MVHQEVVVLREHQDQAEPQDLQDQVVHQEVVVLREHQDLAVLQVLRDQAEPQDLQDQVEPPDRDWETTTS